MGLWISVKLNNKEVWETVLAGSVLVCGGSAMDADVIGCGRLITSMREWLGELKPRCGSARVDPESCPGTRGHRESYRTTKAHRWRGPARRAMNFESQVKIEKNCCLRLRRRCGTRSGVPQTRKRG